MISGYATPEATKTFAEHRLPFGTGALGTTGLTTSQAGFGGYRISAGVPTHDKALETAILAGINLIDTSSNYADGGSETLIGHVLKRLIKSNEVTRQNVIVVSKIGYLQGQNFTLSQKRKKEGRPFPDLVEFGEGLEHCIHPEFVEDQLNRTLDRLNLETLDGLLLHNPEYYLKRAKTGDGESLEHSRNTYHQRIHGAFEHLEKEVKRGRIQFYGISSNTFPSKSSDPGFTSLETVFDIAKSISARHHFRLIQLPLNILEPEAIIEKNQSGGRSVVEYARNAGIGVLVNRPLNGMAGQQLFRLADIAETSALGENEIIQCIRGAQISETGLWRRILPKLGLPHGLVMRIKEQIAIGDGLKHMWKNFGSYERWRQVRDGNFKPRVQGVMNFLSDHAEEIPELVEWMESHTSCMEKAYYAVGSMYGEAVHMMLTRIKRRISAADPKWGEAGTLSRCAVRAVRSSLGVSSVLVGMRKEHYVQDITRELQRPADQKDSLQAWESLTAGLAAILPRKTE